jgi:DNA-binding transcriptional ArsR family regulator
VNELAEPFEMSLPAISRHLKVLERAGMIAQSREKQWRPRRLEPQSLKEAADWLDYYRQFWDRSFDRLDTYLRSLQTKGGGDGPQS